VSAPERRWRPQSKGTDLTIKARQAKLDAINAEIEDVRAKHRA